MADSYLTLKETAELLRTSEKTIHRLLRNKGLPGFKMGGTWRFRREDVDRWAAEQVQKNAGGAA